MTDDLVAMLVAACREAGALAVRDVFVELEVLARGREFAATEVASHAAVPKNQRLREALQAAGAGDARRLGKWLGRWQGRAIDGLRIDAIGSDRDGILWRLSRVESRGSWTDRAHACEREASQPTHTSSAP